jgi:hypothetical protein
VKRVTSSRLSGMKGEQDLRTERVSRQPLSSSHMWYFYFTVIVYSSAQDNEVRMDSRVSRIIRHLSE